MIKELRILIIEDVAADVVLINHELRKGGLTFRSKRVDTKEEFLRELQHHLPDIILSDHGLPSFDGFTALAIARDQCPDVPFIFVSGSIGEEMAVETLKYGAADYVLKGKLSMTLVPAVRQALLRAQERLKRKDAEAERECHVRELEAALAMFKALSRSLPICGRCKRKVRDTRGLWQPLEQYLQPRSDVALASEVCPECATHR
ncbi:MAG: response regulator [Limisphaerales bacterium]